MLVDSLPVALPVREPHHPFRVEGRHVAPPAAPSLTASDSLPATHRKAAGRGSECAFGTGGFESPMNAALLQRYGEAVPAVLLFPSQKIRYCR